MNFPCNSYYNSTYEGVDIEMHIVDHCNLNCAGCNHFSCIASPWFISLDSFEQQISLLSKKIPQLKKFMLLGGEPTLHPQLIELCGIFRKYFPTQILEVLTNGIQIKCVIEHLNEFKQLKVHFRIGEYSNLLKQKVPEDVTTLLKSGLGDIEWGKGCFKQTLVDVTGSQDQDKLYFYDCHHRKPCFTLKDNKIFICPFSAHINIFNKKFNENVPLITDQDYLDLETLTLDKLEQFCYKSKPICKYCKNGDMFGWTQSTFTKDEFTLNLKELYLNNYNLYLQFINNPILINDTDLEKLIDIALAKDYIKYINSRYHNEIDIVIPCYNNSLYNIRCLLEDLQKQTIINKCHIYLIDGGSRNIEEISNFIWDLHKPYITLLRHTGKSSPGLTRNVGIENSHNKYIYFLDSSDKFKQLNSLEYIYNLITTNNLDLVFCQKQHKQEKLAVKSGIYRSEFLKQKNLKFNDWPIYEDAYFYAQCTRSTSKKLLLSEHLIDYNFYDAPCISDNTDTSIVSYYKNKLYNLIKEYDNNVQNS